jgi:hypothetical protein
MSLGEQMKLKQADMERARIDEFARGKMMGVGHESMHAPNAHAGRISPVEQLKLKQAKMEAARDEEINRRKLMGAGHESAHAPNPYAAAAPLGVERGQASNPYAVSASLAEQMKRQKDEMERKRSAEMMNRRKPMDAGYAAGVSLADQMRKEAEMERARNEAFYRRKTMGAGHEAADMANANAASMSLTDGSAAPFGKVDKKAQKLKPAQPNTQLEANKKKAAKETGHAMFEPPENKPPPAAAPIISQPRTRRFPDLEEEAVGQSPNPTITAAMKRPQGRVRMEYAAEKAPGAQGYFIIGEPNAGLMVSGARRVGPDRWYVPPEAVFSVEGPPGKAGVGGYRIKEATFRK